MGVTSSLRFRSSRYPRDQSISITFMFDLGEVYGFTELDDNQGVGPPGQSEWFRWTWRRDFRALLYPLTAELWIVSAGLGIHGCIVTVSLFIHRFTSVRLAAPAGCGFSARASWSQAGRCSLVKRTAAVKRRCESGRQRRKRRRHRGISLESPA